MTRILGIDTGTNSLGWAIVEKCDDGEFRLIDRGVNIFQEGVNIEKGGMESSRAAERTCHKSVRVRYYCVRLRKLRLLRVLSDNGLCPPLSADELSGWRLHKVYPKNELFMSWQSTDDKAGKNPYPTATVACMRRSTFLTLWTVIRWVAPCTTWSSAAAF